jgi:hypothetical protein
MANTYLHPDPLLLSGIRGFGSVPRSETQKKLSFIFYVSQGIMFLSVVAVDQFSRPLSLPPFNRNTSEQLLSVHARLH